jgi:hypothetical protein
LKRALVGQASRPDRLQQSRSLVHGRPSRQIIGDSSGIRPFESHRPALQSQREPARAEPANRSKENGLDIPDFNLSAAYGGWSSLQEGVSPRNANGEFFA